MAEDDGGRRAALVEDFRAVYQAFERHDCDSPSDVCECRYMFNCTKCGKRQIVVGEDLPNYWERDGQCVSCWVGHTGQRSQALADIVDAAYDVANEKAQAFATAIKLAHGEGTEGGARFGKVKAEIAEVAEAVSVAYGAPSHTKARRDCLAELVKHLRTLATLQEELTDTYRIEDVLAVRAAGWEAVYALAVEE